MTTPHSWTGYLPDENGNLHRCWGFGPAPDEAKEAQLLYSAPQPLTAAQPPVYPDMASEPVAWQVLSESGAVRLWAQMKEVAETYASARDLRCIPLYAAPQSSPVAQASTDRAEGLTDEQIEDLRSHIRGTAPGEDTYEYELGSGWRCFHCGEMFRTWGGASLHFGKPIDKRPTCIAATSSTASNADAQAVRVPKVRTSHHRNKEEAARLQELVAKRYTAEIIERLIEETMSFCEPENADEDASAYSRDTLRKKFTKILGANSADTTRSLISTQRDGEAS